MDTAAVAHDDVVMPRREMQVRGLAAQWSVYWSEVDLEWYKCIPCKSLDNQEAAARIALTFARAYLAALVSGQDDPAFHTQGDESRSTPASILNTITQGANARGEVSMSDIVATFEKCPGRIFCQTLTLLTWAGHIGSFNTLARYKYTLSQVVYAYWEDRQRLFRVDADKAQVCPSPTVALRQLL